ncbi:MAG: PilZ domain-containing protein [Planctomycetota bacterium]
MSQRQEERRKWPRLDVAFKIRLKPVGGQAEALREEGFCTKNISTGGLLFESRETMPLSEGAVLDVEISMPLAKYGFTSSRRLEARGKVCRVEQGGPEGSRAVALEFLAPPRFVTG